MLKHSRRLGSLQRPGPWHLSPSTGVGKAGAQKSHQSINKKPKYHVKYEALLGTDLTDTRAAATAAGGGAAATAAAGTAATARAVVADRVPQQQPHILWWRLNSGF